jgi:hypothetical protein
MNLHYSCSKNKVMVQSMMVTAATAPETHILIIILLCCLKLVSTTFQLLQPSRDELFLTQAHNPFRHKQARIDNSCVDLEQP